MPRTCTVCSHPERREIDRALVSRSASYRDVSERFGVSKPAVSRHVRQHLAEFIAKAQAVRDDEDLRHALDVVRQLRAINAASLRILKEARERGRASTALQAVDRIHKQIELQAKLLGDLDERPVVNLNLSPEWLELRAVIVAALEPYSEARESVLRALESGDNGRA